MSVNVYYQKLNVFGNVGLMCMYCLFCTYMCYYIVLGCNNMIEFIVARLQHDKERVNTQPSS